MSAMRISTVDNALLFIYFFISSAWFSFSSTRINNSSAGLCVQRDLSSPHLSSSCLVAHKALTHCLHLFLFMATALTLAQLFISSLSLNLSIVLLQVSFWLSSFVFPSGCNANAVVHILLLSIRKTWHRHLFLYNNFACFFCLSSAIF